jgi:PmbA protein
MNLEQLKLITQDVLQMAKSSGASAAETELSFGTGQSVSVRMGETENIEYNRDKGVSVTVYFGQKKGQASSSDLSSAALVDTVEAACNIAKYTAEDAFCGLADAALMATKFPDLSLYHPWDISVEDALEIAKTCEAAALEVDKKRITNSEGASVYQSEGVFAYANSHGFIGGYPSTRHSISCSVIAAVGDTMQRDYWYSSARDAADMESAVYIGKRAGERTVKRLGARSIKTGQYPVLFEASLASGLISSLLSAISGGNLYRKSSYLLDSLGKQIAAPLLNIDELPHLPKGIASSAFDSEGVATHARKLVENGVLQGYMLSSYSARKLGMQTTGNAGGAHNIVVAHTNHQFADLLALMGTGLLVENGVIAHPVEEITIAGNMKDMLKHIVAIGDDAIKQSSKQTGSILIEQMTVAAGGQS